MSAAPHPEPHLTLCCGNGSTETQHSAAARLDSYRCSQVRPLAGAESLLWLRIVRNVGKSALARAGLIWWYPLGGGAAGGTGSRGDQYRVCKPLGARECVGSVGAAVVLIVGCGRSKCSDLAAGQQWLQLLCKALQLIGCCILTLTFLVHAGRAFGL